MKRIIGLDVGGTKCAVVLARVTDTIEVMDRIAFPTETIRGAEYAQGRLFDAVRDMLKKHSLTHAEISAIGVSCGGPLNSRDGVILCPPNLPGWVNVPIVKLLKDTFGVPAYLQNDAKACALVEWKLGAGRGTHNMIFLTMGTGMGSGIIAEDHLVFGACDMGGEVGHVRMENDGPLGFGKHGSFEGFTSGGGIARFARQRAKEALAAGKPLSFAVTQERIDVLDTRTLAKCAQAGDEDARHLFSLVGEKLGKGLALLIDTLNPEVIVIGGIFSRCEALLRPAMKQVLDRECISYSRAACRVVPAQTGEAIGDLASIMVAVYGSGIPFERKDSPAVQAHMSSLLGRHPALKACADDIRNAYTMLKESYLAGGKLLVCGNGGSAADSDHIVGELMKGFRLPRRICSEDLPLIPGMDEKAHARLLNSLQYALPAIALTQHTALSTAIDNDNGQALSFAQQVFGYGRRGDVLLAISTSGNSSNAVLAAETARSLGLNIIGLTGPRESRLSRLSDVCIRVPGSDTAQVQELHLPVYHALCSMLEVSFFAEDAEKEMNVSIHRRTENPGSNGETGTCIRLK